LGIGAVHEVGRQRATSRAGSCDSWIHAIPSRTARRIRCRSLRAGPVPLSYLRAAELELGLLINFDVCVLKDGVRQLIHSRICER